MSDRTPWHGIIVATSLPFDEDLEVDYEAYGHQVSWLAEQGMDGVAPNGSLGEYQTLSWTERDRVVATAIDNAPEGFTVMPGVGAYSGRESKRHAEVAKDLGAQGVMALPPNAYRAGDRAVLEHFEMIASVGLPVTAYNNPIDTKVDLRPELLAKLSAEGFIVGVKEFSGDVRMCYKTAELAPDLDLMIGTDDTVLEVGICGAKGWVAGFTQVFPQATRALYDASVAGDVATALPLYRKLHPLLRWDSATEFVQAIKVGQDELGLAGTRCRPPRQPLRPDDEASVRSLVRSLRAEGLD